MSRMTRQNLNNIKDIFEEKTGTELTPKGYGISVRKIVLVATVLIFCFALTAFTYPLFSPLRGDELTLAGTYEGNGIISVYVENGSDKDLEFEEQTKLIQWVTGEEVTRLEGEIRFENVAFPAHSSGVMTVDISEAYDMEALEMDGKNYQSYYLLLTNNNFLFGHDWMCSVTFAQEMQSEEQEAASETEAHIAAQAEELAEIEESLRFYFEDSYQDQVPAWNEANFEYLQKVDEIVKRFQGTVVQPLYPTIMVSGPSTLLELSPCIRTEQEYADYEWSIQDGYHRLVGASAFEKALTVTVNIPSKDYPDSVSSIPLRYAFVYAAEEAVPENHAFFYGQIHSFAELESCEVYRDAYYAIYDVTEFFYTDLDAYITFLKQTREDLRIDEETEKLIREIYGYYRENLGNRIYLE